MIKGKYNPYPKYKQSSVEWIGEIPEGWEVTNLKRVLVQKITDGPHETPELIPDGIPFISAEAIKNNKIDFDLRRGNISIQLHKQYCKKAKPKLNDIFFIKSGATTGNIAYVETIEEFSIWSPLALIRCYENILFYKYLFYLMLSNEFRIQVELAWSYGTQQNIGMGVIGRLLIILPPLCEQRAIADFLDRETTRINGIVTQQTQMIELLKEKRSALITQAVTKGLDTKVKLKPSGVQWIGDIPEGWEVRRWRYIAICNPTKGEANISEDIEVQFVPMELVPDEGYLLDLSETRKAHEVYKGYTYFINGDVLIAKITPCFENGKGAIAENLKNGIGFGTTELHVYRAHQDKMNSKYLFMISKLKAFRSLGEASMKGAAGQKRVTDLFIKDSIIPLPPLHEQSAIVEFLDKEMSKIDTLIRKIENQIELLNKYKQSLITHAVTGKIDVRGELNA